ncbi:uncharacterized protein [Rutidosis leptorrhynchoides]|uniref:uncharacterized protein n=1 Tax=Rutidosis leptorrhynchoides TaxID=125765 RepID=UPI003A997750
MDKRYFDDSAGTSRPINNNEDSGPLTANVINEDIGALRPDENSVEDVRVWNGYEVGHAEKDVLQAVERRYPTTFVGILISMKELLVPAFKHFCVFIKGLESFIKTSEDAFKEEEITTLRKHLNDFETFGFDLSWARHRLDMVEELKSGNNSLLNELAASEECLSTVKKTYVQALKKLQAARLELDEATEARNNKAKDMARKLAEAYDPIL